MSAPKDQFPPKVCPNCDTTSKSISPESLWGESVEVHGWICNKCQHIVYAERRRVVSDKNSRITSQEQDLLDEYHHELSILDKQSRNLRELIKGLEKRLGLRSRDTEKYIPKSYPKEGTLVIQAGELAAKVLESQAAPMPFADLYTKLHKVISGNRKTINARLHNYYRIPGARIRLNSDKLWELVP